MQYGKYVNIDFQLFFLMLKQEANSLKIFVMVHRAKKSVQS